MGKEWIIQPRAVPSAEWLAPNYERDLHDPFLLPDMARAVERIARAIRDQEKILIFADYDADGVPGAAILASFFDKIGFANYQVYIPDRHLEDYGLSRPPLGQAAAAGATLVITIDCGTANAAEIAYANGLGMEVIVTDHHLVPVEGLPPAYAVVNPERADSQYPERGLCGAGVVFKLVQGLMQAPPAKSFSQVLGNNPQTMQKASDQSAPFGWEKWLLDLVAIATVGDMVPLTGENRALVHFGLKVLRRSPRPGLQQLCRELRLEPAYLTEDDIGFSIAPRINTASRMAHAREAFELLTTSDVSRAGAIAARLEKLNRERKMTVERVLRDLAAHLGTEFPSGPLVVAGSPEWSLGVLGLAASRAVERYARPVFLWGRNGHGALKGSCRSDGTINVVELMQVVDAAERQRTGENFFLNVGGHERAGGFSLAGERAGELEERLLAVLENIEPLAVAAPALILERELSLADVTLETYEQISHWGPFGLGNPRPIFLFPNLEVNERKLFGGEKNHLELIFRDPSGASRRRTRAISFFQTFPHFDFAAGRLDLAATLERSQFRGLPELRLRIVDLRPAE